VLFGTTAAVKENPVVWRKKFLSWTCPEKKTQEVKKKKAKVLAKVLAKRVLPRRNMFLIESETFPRKPTPTFQKLWWISENMRLSPMGSIISKSWNSVQTHSHNTSTQTQTYHPRTIFSRYSTNTLIGRWWILSYKRLIST
jgi:hypothetical protein